MTAILIMLSFRLMRMCMPFHAGESIKEVHFGLFMTHFFTPKLCYNINVWCHILTTKIPHNYTLMIINLYNTEILNEASIAFVLDMRRYHLVIYV